jgi:Carboxypeptidase regulatory-like domain
MSFRFVGYFAAFTVAIALLCIAGSPLYGQISSGTIVGTIVDQSGQSVPNAKVELFNEDTGTIDRTITTGENGGFLFASASPGKYTVRVEAGGFQRFERKENNLVSGDRLSLGDIQLSVGALT